MPQLILVALIGVGLWAGYRWIQKEAAKLARNAGDSDKDIDSPASQSGKKVESDKEAQSAKKNRNRDAETLEYDPETGVYQPKE